jgi:hypothetical protein
LETPLNPVPKYLPRGVYRAPCLSSSGKPILFAVDHSRRLVDGSRTEVEPGQDEQPIINALWHLLDAADPEHSRRRSVRTYEAASQIAKLAAVCCTSFALLRLELLTDATISPLFHL